MNLAIGRISSRAAKVRIVLVLRNRSLRSEELRRAITAVVQAPLMRPASRAMMTVRNE